MVTLNLTYVTLTFIAIDGNKLLQSLNIMNNERSFILVSRGLDVFEVDCILCQYER